MVDIEQLTTPLTLEQVRSTHYSVLEAIGVNVTSWKPGNPVRTIIAAISTWQSSFTYWACNAIKSRFLTLSRCDWLTANAKYDYGTDRNDETYATGPVTLANSGSGVYSFDPGDLTLEYSTLLADGLSPVTYKYSNSEAVIVAAGPSSQSVVFVAELSGSAPSIPISAPIVLNPPYTGLTVTATAAISGTDKETDQALITRALEAMSAISPNGPADAYRYVATSLLINGAPVCTRVQVVPGNPLTVYLGNGSGGVSGSELDALKLELQTKVVPLGVIANIVGGTTKDIFVTYTVWCNKTTLSTKAITDAITAALDEYLSTFPMGGNPVAVVDSFHFAGSHWLYLSSLKAVIESALDDQDGVANPVYYAEVTTQYTTYDVLFALGDIAALGAAPNATVLFG